MVLKTYHCGKCDARLFLDEGKDINLHTCTCKSKNWILWTTEYTAEEWALEISSFKYIWNEIVEILGEYIDIPIDKRKIIALWIMGTYAIESFHCYPFLFFNAMRGSGKTRTITLCSHLANGSKGKVYTGITEAGLYRSEPYSTLVLDECERITTKEQSTLREYLQASYKSSATVMRAVKKKIDNKETYVMEEFKPFRPIIMANINGMDEVLGDRCLTTYLEKSIDQRVTMIIEDFEDNQRIKDLLLLLNNKQCSYVGVCRSKNTIRGWNNYINYHLSTLTLNYTTTQTTLNYITTLQEEDRVLFEKIIKLGINGRNLELIFPLIIVARSIDESLIDEVLPILSGMIEQKKEEESVESRDVSFIQFIAENSQLGQDFILIKNLTQKYKEYIGWTQDEEWLNNYWVGKALMRLQLVGKKRRVSQGQEVILLNFKAKEMLKKFAVEKPDTTSIKQNELKDI